MFFIEPSLILVLAGLWMCQLFLAQWQMHRFYKRIAQLRQRGLVSVGMQGSAWRRRQYAVLVVDKNKTIVHVEQLSGWTVLAQLRPVNGLAGQPMSVLLDDAAPLPVSKKLRAALRNAAEFILADETRKQRKADADRTSVENRPLPA